MTVRLRFAPSPTGLLHLGNARTALVNALYTRRHGGAFILRIDDTDRARSEDRFVDAIRADLRWLGLGWDEEYRQTERHARHLAAFERLRKADRVYPCSETAEELEAWRAARRPAIYKRGSLPEGEGATYWRFDLGENRIAFEDLVQGPQDIDLASQSDLVVLRADGTPTFLFASVVDDVDLRISHVIRGADHITNTGTQIAMTRAMGAAAPMFAHLPLILDVNGHVLSKRTGSQTLRSLREHGIEPTAVNLLLASLGTNRAPNPADDLGQLATRFDLTAFGRSQPRLDIQELRRLTAELTRRNSFDVALERLSLPRHGPIPHEMIQKIKILAELHDAGKLDSLFQRRLAPTLEDPAYCRLAADLLPDPVDFDAWIDALKAATGRKGRALFHPLRLALTARERGPELKLLLTLLPRETILRRLRGETA